MKRVLIVDDHAVVRKGLQQILAGAPEVGPVIEASSGDEALAEIEKQQFDLVLLDISLPGKNGIEVLRQIKDRQPQIPVLMLSIHSEEEYAVRAIKMGAAGYLTKDRSPDDLVNAVRLVLQGHRYISSSLAEKLINSLEDNSTAELHKSLSEREYQVLCLIASGASLKEIGSRLHVSTKTVSTYRSRILEKMKIKSNAEITRYAVLHNLIL